jgi:protein TonB
MFKVLEGRKRRVFSPATMVASVAAHLLLLGGAVYAAASDTGPREVVEGEVILPPLPSEPPAPQPVEPTPPPPAPEPAAPDEPAPTPGARLDLPTPAEPPVGIIDEPPGVQPVDPKDFGDGPTGDIIGPPPVTPTLPTGDITPAPTAEPYVPAAEDVEEQPVLNRNGLSRTMERYYPSTLANSRVTGRVVVELIVDEDGRVRANSARVVETTHPAFAEATLRAVERFRFRPAKMAGVPVPVRVTIPINWTVPE